MVSFILALNKALSMESLAGGLVWFESHLENSSGHGCTAKNYRAEREVSRSAASHAGASKRCGENKPRQDPLKIKKAPFSDAFLVA